MQPLRKEAQQRQARLDGRGPVILTDVTQCCTPVHCPLLEPRQILQKETGQSRLQTSHTAPQYRQHRISNIYNKYHHFGSILVQLNKLTMRTRRCHPKRDNKSCSAPMTSKSIIFLQELRPICAPLCRSLHHTEPRYIWCRPPQNYEPWSTF